jgi:energy-converting hydrogenase Eha subunit C
MSTEFTPADGTPVGPVPRSTFITVLGWVGIAIAGGYGLTLILQFAVMQFFLGSGRVPTPDPDEFAAISPMIGWFVRNFRLYLISMIAICMGGVVASIGLLRRRPWGRVTTIAMMVIGIVWSIVSVVIAEMAVPNVPPDPNVPGGVATMFALATWGARIASALLALVSVLVFGWLIHKLRTPAIRAEFQR